MPRQRKPQSGATRTFGTWRVANTTTAQEAVVYRIPTGKRYGECETRNFEILGTAPISVRIEDNNVYQISIDSASLKNMIESYEGLDLSSVTLQTINGNVEFTWSITADGTFTGTSATFDDVTTATLTASSWQVSSLTSTDITTSSLDASDIETATLETSWKATLASLEVTGTSALNGNVTAGGDIAATGALSAASANIPTITSNSISTGTLAASNGATVANGLTVTDGISTDTLTASGDISADDISANGTLSVTGASNFTGDVSAVNLIASGNTSVNDLAVAGNETVTGNATINGATVLNNTLTVAWASTLGGAATVAGNLSVGGNQIITGTQTVTGDTILNGNLSVANDINAGGDVNVSDDLTVNGDSHFKTIETTWSSTIGGTLRVDWAITAWNGIDVTGQVESDTMVTGSIVASNATINGNLVLGPDAQANQFVLQDEKNQPNGIPTLNAQWQIDTQYLPQVFTTAVVKVGNGVFNNSDTSVVVDADITNDSVVMVSNYQDIVWDLNEVINVWQLTVVSNQTETGSYKYVVINPLS